VLRGRIGDEPPPETGETFVSLVAAAGVTIEEIVSASVSPGAVYEQDHDEWVLVVSGGARLTVGEDPVERVELVAGDWLWLPAGVRHVVESVEPGTRWVAVHLPPASDGGVARLGGDEATR
jgi:cupin 2 domain-containing protein